MKLNNIYNNEAIAAVTLGSFLKIHKNIDFSTSLLILPFLLHDPTVKRLNSKAFKRSFEEFIVQYPDLLVGFNSRFKGFLPLTMNSITILNESKVIVIGKNKISYNENSGFNPTHTGNRFEKIYKATGILSELFFLESSPNLFLKLKIEL